MENMNLPVQREAARAELPSGPLLQGEAQTSELRRWEVVLAYNLQPPLRLRQDYWWLEVLAESAQAARLVAWDWVRRNPDTRFECTDWIRLAAGHPESVQVAGDPYPLPVQWQVPMPSNWPLEMPLRHPATGIRVGFRDPRDPSELGIAEENFALIRHLPASSADLVCLVPLVENIAEANLSATQR